MQLDTAPTLALRLALSDRTSPAQTDARETVCGILHPLGLRTAARYVAALASVGEHPDHAAIEDLRLDAAHLPSDHSALATSAVTLYSLGDYAAVEEVYTAFAWDSERHTFDVTAALQAVATIADRRQAASVRALGHLDDE